MNKKLRSLRSLVLHKGHLSVLIIEVYILLYIMDIRCYICEHVTHCAIFLFDRNLKSETHILTAAPLRVVRL